MSNMFSSVDKEKLGNYLKEAKIRNVCPLCGQPKLTVEGTCAFQLMPVPRNGGLTLGAGPVLQLVPIYCQNCGNTMFINARQKDLLVDAKEVPTPNE